MAKTTASKIWAANEKLIGTQFEQFVKMVPDDEAALNLILKTLVRNKMLVCGCGYVFKNAHRQPGSRKLICPDCRDKVFFTAGTIYGFAKAVWARMGLVWLTDKGAIVTSTKAKALFGISTSSALDIIKSISFFIEATRAHNFAGKEEQINCPVFTGIMIKRSRISIAYAHAATAPEDAQDTDQDEITDNPTLNELSEEERAVYDSLSNSARPFEEICEGLALSTSAVSAALTILEMYGLITSLAGNMFARVQAVTMPKIDAEISEKTMRLIRAAMVRIKIIRQGVSRKYLQLYLANFWCYYDRKIWRNGVLWMSVLDASRIENSNLYVYESPRAVSLMPRCS